MPVSALSAAFDIPEESGMLPLKLNGSLTEPAAILAESVIL